MNMRRTRQALASAIVVILLGACGSDRAETGDTEAKPAKSTPKLNEAKSEKTQTAGGAKGLTLSEEEARRAGIKTLKVESQEVSESFAASGTLTPNLDRVVRVLPRAPGRIVKSEVAAGQDVRAGQILTVIESAEVGDAQSSYAQARSEEEVAQAALRRSTTLFREQVVPEKDLLKARSDANRASAARQAAQARLSLLGADLPESSITRATATYALTAPFAGTIIEKKAVAGDLTASDQPLFVIADLAKVWVEIDLNERDLASVRRGGVVSASVPAYPEETFKGRLGHVADTLDKVSHTVKARVELDNAARRLKPGMFAKVAIATAATRKGIALPRDAVVLIQNQSTVFVLDDGHFESVPVQAMPLPDGRLIVVSGLENGDEVVVSGAFALKARMLKSQISDD